MDPLQVRFCPTTLVNANTCTDQHLPAAQHVATRGMAREPDLCSSLEDDWLMVRAFAIRKRADCLCRFIVETSEQLVKTFDAEFFEEPFTVRCISRQWLLHYLAEDLNVNGREGGSRRDIELWLIYSYLCRQECCWGLITYIYGPGSSFHASKDRHVSSTKTGPPICIQCQYQITIQPERHVT